MYFLNFLQVVDVDAGAIVFDEELYAEMEYRTPEPKFHSFEGKTEVVGLHFADGGEADQFEKAIQERIRKRNQRRPNPASKKPEVKPKPEPEVGLASKDQYSKDNSAKKEKKKKGWFSFIGNNSDPPEQVIEKKAKKLLDAAGIDRNVLEDSAQRNEIYSFIITYDVPDDIVSQEMTTPDGESDQDAPCLPEVPASRVLPTPEHSRFSLPGKASPKPSPMTYRRTLPMAPLSEGPELGTQHGSEHSAKPQLPQLPFSRGGDSFQDRSRPTSRRLPPPVPGECSSSSALNAPALPAKPGFSITNQNPGSVSALRDENYRNVFSARRDAVKKMELPALQGHGPQPTARVDSSSAVHLSPPPLPTKAGQGITNQNPIKDDNYRNVYSASTLRQQAPLEDSHPPVLLDKSNSAEHRSPPPLPTKARISVTNTKPGSMTALGDENYRDELPVGKPRQPAQCDDSPPPIVPRDKLPQAGRDQKDPPALPTKLSKSGLNGSRLCLTEEADPEYNNSYLSNRNDRLKSDSLYSSKLSLAPSKLGPPSRNGSSESMNGPQAPPVKPGPKPVSRQSCDPSVGVKGADNKPLIPSRRSESNLSPYQRPRFVRENIPETKAGESLPRPGRSSDGTVTNTEMLQSSPKLPSKPLKLNLSPINAPGGVSSQSQAQKTLQHFNTHVTQGSRESQLTNELPSKQVESTRAPGSGKAAAVGLKAGSPATPPKSRSPACPPGPPISLEMSHNDVRDLKPGYAAQKPFQPKVPIEDSGRGFEAPKEQPKKQIRLPPPPPTAPGPGPTVPPPPPIGLQSQRSEPSSRSTPTPPSSAAGGKEGLLEQIRKVGGFKGAVLRQVQRDEGQQPTQPKDGGGGSNSLTDVLLLALNTIQKANNSSGEEGESDDEDGCLSTDSWD